MKNLVKSFDNLPWIVKIILALPIIDGLAWGIYRLVKGIDKNDLFMIIAGVVWIFAGILFLWIIDLVCVIIYKKVVVFA